MQIFSGLEEVVVGPTVVTVGNFDGVHLGHRALIAKLIEMARKYDAEAALMTFHPHPVQLLHPEKALTRMFDRKDHLEVFSALGVDFLIEQKFTREFASIHPAEFLNNYLMKFLNPRAIVVGYDFSFGQKRLGTIELLASVCEKWGIPLVVEPAYLYKGSVVSSTRIRAALQSADTQLANEMLGRPYYLRGHVIKGQQRGRLIGVPTANIESTCDFIPHPGVYITKTYWGNKSLPSITNIGINPTFQQSSDKLGSEKDLSSWGRLKLENHILNFNENLYGQELKVELLEFVRNEEKFSSVEDLLARIRFDIGLAKNYFGLV